MNVDIQQWANLLARLEAEQAKVAALTMENAKLRVEIAQMAVKEVESRKAVYESLLRMRERLDGGPKR